MLCRSVSFWPFILFERSCVVTLVFAGCGVFGRDEGDSEFSFAQGTVDVLIEKWRQTVRAEGYSANGKPTAATIMVVELCISDKNKPLLLNNAAFIPYVVDALLLVRPL